VTSHFPARLCVAAVTLTFQCRVKTTPLMTTMTSTASADDGSDDDDDNDDGGDSDDDFDDDDDGEGVVVTTATVVLNASHQVGSIDHTRSLLSIIICLAFP
jgi:hypothetical protein